MRRRPGARTVWWRQRYESKPAPDRCPHCHGDRRVDGGGAVLGDRRQGRDATADALDRPAADRDRLRRSHASSPGEADGVKAQGASKIRIAHDERTGATGRALTPADDHFSCCARRRSPTSFADEDATHPGGTAIPEPRAGGPDAQGKAGADTGSGAGAARADTPTGVSTACPGGASSTVDQRLRVGAKSAQSCCTARPMLGTWAWTSQHHGAVHGAWTR